MDVRKFHTAKEKIIRYEIIGNFLFAAAFLLFLIFASLNISRDNSNLSMWALAIVFVFLLLFVYNFKRNNPAAIFSRFHLSGESIYYDGKPVERISIISTALFKPPSAMVGFSKIRQKYKLRTRLYFSDGSTKDLPSYVAIPFAIAGWKVLDEIRGRPLTPKEAELSFSTSIISWILALLFILVFTFMIISTLS